jgi:RNA polymerase sigma-70 factor (ECF subfamily)
MDSSSKDLAALMRQAQAGDPHAYTQVLHETASILRLFLRRWLKNPSEIDDVIQEILISIHKSRHTYDGLRPYKPWVFAIARYRLSEYWRRAYADKLRHATDLADIENTVAAPVTNSGDTTEHLLEGLKSLPAKQAEIVRLIHTEGHTAKEVAARMGMKESAVKVAAHRAYKILRRKLEDI